MSNPNKPDPIEPVELHPIDMHGPVEVTAKLYVILPDGRPATLGFTMEAGQIPSRGKIAATMNAMLDPDSIAESSIPAGTRPMTKPEFVAHITKRDTGQSIPMPGDQHFVPVPPDVPREMLVHAVMGVWANCEGDMELEDEYIARGLGALTRSTVRKFKWDRAALDALPDDVLLAIYERITA